jgi:isoquinoline 1-oxidoreductase beta subunit
VVEVPKGVAVIAENTWAAIQGRRALKVTWDEGENNIHSTESIRRQLADRVNKAIAAESKNTLTSIEAIYETPYLAHASMEPVNCVADYHSDRCDIWASTQNPQDIQTFVRSNVGVPVNVNVTLLGGGFGRRLEVDYAIEAAQISKAAGAPVQLVWTREDDIQHDYYRQPTYHWMRAGWDNQGELGLWRHFMAGPGLNGIAYRVGQEVLEEGLMAPYRTSNGISRSFLVDIPLPTGPWRAVMSGPNAFANECFFDEVAAALKKDPYEFRMELLGKSDVLRSVLELVALKSNWGTPAPEGQGRGIACHTYHNTAVAMVADVSVQDGKVRVHKVVCAINCGRAIHPDMVTQQMEGSIVFGLTSLLKGEITFEGGRVQQGNFNDYPILQISEMPEVEVHIVPEERAPTGTGEMGVPPLVPAVVNAIFNATGIRVRHTPIRAEDLSKG